MGVEKVGNYGKAALLAVELIKTGKTDDPIDAWERATSQIFGGGTASQRKGCPKGAFLGLCEEGLIKGIPREHYTKSEKNKSYAIKAINLLKNNLSKYYTEENLWTEVVGNQHKTYNQQMDVVLSLWKNGLIN